MTNQPALPTDVYLVFCGSIDQQSVARLFNSLALATNPAHGIKRIHLLFQSTGGYVSDGICLYNFFKALNVDLFIYNVGAIQSIATIAYLGAKRRITSASAIFMVHKTFINTISNTARIKSIAHSLCMDDERIEAILRSHVSLSEESWIDHAHNDLIFTGNEAVRVKIADEIGEFAPPPGIQIYNV